MKRIWLFILMIVCFIPGIVKAETITSTKIEGTNAVELGETFTLNFEIAYTGVFKGIQNTTGVAAVSMEVNFDENVFSILSAEAADFDTTIIKEDGTYYVVSIIDENDTTNNKCVDGVLYCGGYFNVDVKFYTRKTSETSSIIGIGETEVLLYQVNSQYTDDDATIIDTPRGYKKTITISSLDEEVDPEPESSVIESSQSGLQTIVNKADEKIGTTQDIDKGDSSDVKEASQNYLKELEIENYEITFDKKTTYYEIKVDGDINKLKIKAVAEDENNPINIIGADDLKKNNYTVLIEVGSGESKKTYTINVRKEREREIAKVDVKVDKKLKNYFISGFCALSGLAIIIYIFLKIKNRKLNKALKDFDKM